MAEDFADTSGANILSEIGEGGGCQNPKHVPVFINGMPSGCASITHFDDYYNPGEGGGGPTINIPTFESFWGELPEGADGWRIGDLNGDGVREVYAYTISDLGETIPHTVYNIDADGNIITTSYEEWSAPDLSELIEQYGEDVVNDLKGKYDELVDFIGNIPEDPLGSLKKMAEIFIEGATGIDPQCTGAAGPGTETELETWLLDCVNIGILVDIGIPGLPGLGGIFKNTTLRDIKEAAEKVGSTLEDFIKGNPTCGEKNDQECTPEQILEDLGDWVVRSVEDIFGGSTDPIDIETILGKLGGIFGPILSGIIYDQFKDLINGEIEDVIGVPVIPFAPLQECEDKGLVTIEDPAGSGNFKCGTECKQQGFTPTGPQGECIDPNAVEDYDCSEAGREQVAGARSAADCGPCTEETEDGTQFEPNPTTGFCEDPTVDDTALTEQEQLCKDTGRKYDDLNDICLEECENAQYVIKADGDCGPPDNGPEEGTDCPEGQVRRGGLPEGECVKPGVICYTDPSKYPGDATDINQGQYNSEGFCVSPAGGGQCPSGNTPEYFPEDTDQDGTFFYSGETITYDPCDPAGPQNSMSFTPAPELVCNDKNAGPPDGDDGGCGPCNSGYDKPEGYDSCVSIVDVLCKDTNVANNYEQCKTEETPDDIGEEGDDCTVEIPAFYAAACSDAPMSSVSGKVKDGKCVPTLGQSCQSVLSNCESAPNGVVRTTQYSESGYACEGTAAPEGDLECTKEDYTGNKVYNAHFGKCLPPCPENQVRKYNGWCGPIGSDCIQQQYGNEPCTGIGTDYGKLQADGTCVCPEPEVDCSEITETNYEDCNKVKCPEGSTTPYADSLDDCVAAPTPTCEENDPNSESDGQGGCRCKQDYALDNDQNSPTFGTCQPTKLPPEECKDDQGNPTGAENYPACDICPQGQDFNEKGICVDTTTEQCVTPDGTPTGATLESGCEVCPTGQDFNTDGICVDTLLPEVCNDPNAVNDGQDGPCECKPGFTKNAEGLCFQSGELCENGATVESGCDTCPDGSSVLEHENGECPSEPPEECANGATDYPDCTVCPEGQSMDDSGNCVTIGEPPVEPPETGGGGGGGGGGMLGSFTPFMAGISYTPQAVPEPAAPPQKDYMAELDNLIKRSLFEGMA